MFSRKATALCLAGALALAPAHNAAAGSGDILGGIVGGIIGGAIVNGASNQRRTTTTTRRSTSSRSTVSSAQRQQNREVQTALNYFGFPAGTPDGVLGRKSREATSGMQAFLDLPVTGRLNTFERDILIGAHARAISGNPDVLRLVSTSPLGARAALIQQRDLMTGTTTASATRTVGYPGLPLEVSQAVDEIAASSDPSADQLLQRSGFIQLADLNGDGNNDYIMDTSFSGSSFWCSSVQCKTLVFVSTPQGYARNDLLAFSPTPATFECFGSSCRLAPEDGGDTVMAAAPAPAAPALPDTDAVVAAVAPSLPTFGAPAAAPVAASLQSHCGKVNLLTATRGGFVTLAAGGDPAIALAEQFCLARAFAIDTADQAVAGLGGVTPEQVAAQCDAFAPAMQAQVTALSVSPMSEVMSSVSSFVLGTGMSPEQLKTTATICLGAGYKADKMDVAIGSGLLLVALGSAPHAELLGHHLGQGFGASERPELAAAWYKRAVEALAGGATAVFAPTVADRADLLVWAVAGGGDSAALEQDTGTAVPVALPTFSLEKN